MAQDNEVYANIEEDYTSLGTTTNKGTTATVKSMGETGARAVPLTNAKLLKWIMIILVHVVVTLVWCGALTGVIIWNNIKHSMAETEKITAHACEKFPCTNDGICIMKNQTPQCVCPTGFTGDLCEINLSQLCTYHTCLNGGVCTVKDDTVKAHCICSQGYSGVYCETVYNQSMVVAFNTKLSASFAHGGIGVNKIVPFANVTLNIGNGFDGSSHKFTAPVSGIYMFTFCAFSDGANGKIRVCLMLNGGISTTVFAMYDKYDSACNTELFKLSAGDVVHVELNGIDSTKGLYDNTWNYNTFSGHLVHHV